MSSIQIHGLNKTTLLDYPEHLAATVFLGCCNFRCTFCQNASLVLDPASQPVISEEDFFSFLNKRKNILQGICITGGEPTLSDALPDFIAKIKTTGLKVKLDTNGYKPDMLRFLINENLLDMVAMDIKAAPMDYSSITQIADFDFSKISTSVDLLMHGTLAYEFRTTVVDEYFNEDSFLEIGKWLCGAKAYFLQCFRDSDHVLTPGLHAPSRESLQKYQQILLPYISNVQLRGID